MTLQLVLPDIRQSCILLAAVRSRASHIPAPSRRTAIINPAIAPRRVSFPSGSAIVPVRRPVLQQRVALARLLGERSFDRPESAEPSAETRSSAYPATRLRRHWVFWRELCTTGATGRAREQVVRRKVLVHRQSTPSSRLGTGFGLASSTKRKAPTLVNVTIAATSVTFLRLHWMLVIAMAPSSVFQSIRASRLMVCDRPHSPPKDYQCRM